MAMGIHTPHKKLLILGGAVNLLPGILLLKIPLRGYVVLWVIAISVLLAGIVELIYQVRGRHIS